MHLEKRYERKSGYSGLPSQEYQTDGHSHEQERHSRCLQNLKLPTPARLPDHLPRRRPRIRKQPHRLPQVRRRTSSRSHNQPTRHYHPLHHVAFAYPASQTCRTHTRSEQLDIKPTYSINHGPTASIYYKTRTGTTSRRRRRRITSIRRRRRISL